MRRKTYLGALGIVICLVCLYFIYNKIKIFLNKDDILLSGNVESPDGVSPMHIDNFKLQETDGSSLLWKLDSKESDIYRENGYILFNKVKALINSVTDDNHYNITSEKATYYIKDEKIFLNGNVKIKTSSGYIFGTDAVMYDTVKKEVESDMAVVAKGPLQKDSSLEIEGIGLLGDINTGDFKISRKVRTKAGSKLEIKSDKVTFDTDTNVANFEDNVSARKENIDIKGDELQLLYDKQGSSMKELNVKGNVKLNIKDEKSQEERKAFCNNASLSGTSSMVILTGKPEFHSQGDVMVGDKIVFYTDSDEVSVESVKAEVSGKGAKKK